MTNTFSIRSREYASRRPTYPSELYQWLVNNTDHQDAAWDCATGNGQCAFSLSKHFRKVVGTDISEQQIEAAKTADNLIYRVCSAENTPFEDGQFDLVTVAQALHWFSYDEFWPEVRRVLKPGGLFCAWAYNWFEDEEELDRHLMQPIMEVLQPYWSSKNAIAWRGYIAKEIAFPFKPIKTPNLSIAMSLSVKQTVEFIETWSAYKKAALDPSILEDMTKLFMDAKTRWGEEHIFHPKMPLAIVAGHRVCNEFSFF